MADARRQMADGRSRIADLQRMAFVAAICHPPSAIRSGRENQVPGTDRDRLAAALQHRAAVLVDAAPGAGDGAVAEDALDAIARLVNREGAPLGEHFVVIERACEARVDVLDESQRRVLDAVEIARRR